MDIRNADITQASSIASLIMEAMNYDCCRYFTGEKHSLEEFHKLITDLVSSEDTQYSFKNAIVAIDNNEVAGVIISYNGALLHKLREKFIYEVRRLFDNDISNIPDETSAGELYIDSLAVNKKYRHQGIATKLIKACIKRANCMNIGNTGLLVDNNNNKAEQLYISIGFKYVGDNTWGGHTMKHLQIKIK